MNFVTFSKNVRQNPKPFLKRFSDRRSVGPAVSVYWLYVCFFLPLSAQVALTFSDCSYHFCRGHWGPFGPTSPHKIVLKRFLHKQMTEKIAFKSWAKKLAKNVKNSFFKMHFVTTSKNVRQIPKPFLERFFLVVF